MPEYYEMIDGGEHNVYHILFYMLSNFIISNIQSEIVYYYPNKKNCKVSEGFLSLLPSNFTRHLVKDPSISYKSFLHAIPVFKDIALPQSYYLIRHLFKDHMSASMVERKKLYIQRKNTATRPLKNEEELRHRLESLGFTTVALEDYEIKEQIHMVSEAEYIVGVHGAGLAFTVFCNQRAKVVELCESPTTEHKHYYHIAHILKHSFIRFQTITTETGVDMVAFSAFLHEWIHPHLF
jgi:hypothetical protein